MGCLSKQDRPDISFQIEDEIDEDSLDDIRYLPPSEEDKRTIYVWNIPPWMTIACVNQYISEGRANTGWLPLERWTFVDSMFANSIEGLHAVEAVYGTREAAMTAVNMLDGRVLSPGQPPITAWLTIGQD